MSRVINFTLVILQMNEESSEWNESLKTLAHDRIITDLQYEFQHEMQFKGEIAFGKSKHRIDPIMLIHKAKQYKNKDFHNLLTLLAQFV